MSLVEKRELAPHAHPLVREFYHLLKEEDVTVTEVSLEAGVSRAAMVKWKSRHAPNVPTFEAALNALGYELTIRKRAAA